MRDHDLRNRYGTFTIPRSALQEPDGMQGVFHDMVVFRAEEDWRGGGFGQRIRYWAWHPQFRVVDPGEITPEYEGTFTDGATTPTWAEVAR